MQINCQRGSDELCQIRSRLLCDGTQPVRVRLREVRSLPPSNGSRRAGEAAQTAGLFAIGEAFEPVLPVLRESLRRPVRPLL